MRYLGVYLFYTIYKFFQLSQIIQISLYDGYAYSLDWYVGVMMELYEEFLFNFINDLKLTKLCNY